MRSVQYRQMAATTVTANVQNVAAFLIRHGRQRFCARCVARAVRLRSVAPAERAMKALTSDPDYRFEEADCGRCHRTTLTICALWTGM